MNPGIETIAYYTPDTYLDLKTLAEKRGVDPDKFTIGISQEKMAVPAPDEDVVTMAANAAQKALADTDPAAIDTLMFATESGVD
ncbi:MAG: hydroxymethylglutaryl-CoA synthase, partial [Verrucomicrobiota bacterium]